MATEKEQKAKAKQDKADFNLHVSLLMRMGKKLPDARVQAWLDGSERVFKSCSPEPKWGRSQHELS